MPLPRSKLALNKNTHKKNATTKELAKKTGELNSICEKHKVGNLTFKTCKLATQDGMITFVDHDEIRGNMKSGIMVVKASTLSETSNVIYDLVLLEKEKKASDLKKHEEEMENAKIEIDRLKKNQEKAALPEADGEHQKLLSKLINQPVDTDIITEAPSCIEPSVIEDSENTENIEKCCERDTANVCNHTDSDTKEDNMEAAIENSKKIKKDNSVRAKREKALKQLNDQLMAKAKAKPKGNKFFRNFMKDLRAKFTLLPEEKYKFFEVKAETTDMVIDSTTIYKIIMPNKTKETYLLVIGDLQMKSRLMRQIDPNYKSEKVLEEQNEFLERIQAKENAKVRAVSEQLIDEEFDELNELGLSDSDDDNDEIIPDLVQSPEIINSLMNPELVELKEANITSNEMA